MSDAAPPVGKCKEFWNVRCKPAAIYLRSVDFPLDLFAVIVGFLFILWVGGNRDQLESVMRKRAGKVQVYSSQWNCDSMLNNVLFYPWATRISKAWTVIIVMFTCFSGCLLILRSLGYLPHSKLLGKIYLVATVILFFVVLICSVVLASDLQKKDQEQKIKKYEKNLPKSSRIILRRDVVIIEEREEATRKAALVEGVGLHYPCINWFHRVPLCFFLGVLYIISGLRCFFIIRFTSVGNVNEVGPRPLRTSTESGASDTVLPWELVLQA